MDEKDFKCKWTKISGWDSYPDWQRIDGHSWNPTSLEIIPKNGDTKDAVLWGYLDQNDVFITCIGNGDWTVLSGN